MSEWRVKPIRRGYSGYDVTHPTQGSFRLENSDSAKELMGILNQQAETISKLEAELAKTTRPYTERLQAKLAENERLWAEALRDGYEINVAADDDTVDMEADSEGAS